MDLAKKHCVPCEGGVKPFTSKQLEPYLVAAPGWLLAPDAKEISKQYRFKDFKAALAFVNDIGAIAESEQHHPDIELSWGRVRVSLSTHAIKGLSENDFILAVKIDQLKSAA